MRLCVLTALYLAQLVAVESDFVRGKRRVSYWSDSTADRQQPRCQYPDNLPSNVRVRIRSRGRTARFLCDQGYTLVGSRFSTCLRGHWNNSPPICIRAGCKNRNAPADGRVTENYGGGLLVYGCNPGYRLTGSTISSCDGALWNSSEPSCKVATTNPSPSCNFEEPDLCGWSHGITHNFEWKRNRFGTPSGHVGTGPSEDHTLGPNNQGHYIYLEASAPRVEGDKARLYSPVYGAETSNACFQFWYHMYGSTTGSLQVYLKQESQVLAELTPLWTLSGDQGNQWRQGFLDVPKLNTRYQMVIEGVRGTDYMGDSAIDDVELVSGPCESTTTDITDLTDNSTLTSSEEEESGSKTDVSTSSTPSNVTSVIPGTVTNGTLEKEELTPGTIGENITTSTATYDTDAVQNNTNDRSDYNTTALSPSTNTEITPTEGGAGITDSQGDNVPASSSTVTQSPICVVDMSKISNKNDSFDSDVLLGISNCTTAESPQYSDSQLTTLPGVTQSVSSTELRITIPPIGKTDSSTPPSTSTSDSDNTTWLTGTPIASTNNPMKTTGLSNTSTKSTLKLTISTSTTITNSGYYTTPPFTTPRTTFPATTSATASRRTTMLPTPIISRKVTIKPSVSVTTPFVTVTTVWRRLVSKGILKPSTKPFTAKTSRVPMTTVTSRPSSVSTDQPILTTPNRFIWTLRNTSRRFWRTTGRPSTTKTFRYTYRPIYNVTQVSTRRPTTSRPGYRSTQTKSFQATPTTTLFRTTTTTKISAKTSLPTPKLQLTTRSKNDVIEDSDEDYNNTEEIEIDLTPQPSVFRFQEFPRPNRPSSSNSESGPSVAVVATSLLAVVIVASAAAVTYYFLSGRGRRPKQRSLSDDSEMRFLPQSEEVEISLADHSEGSRFK